MSSNIFKKSFENKFEAKQRVQNIHKGWAYLFAALVLLGAYSYFFFYPQLIQFLEAPKALESMEENIKKIEDVERPALQASRDLKKAAYDAELNTVEENIDHIFPAGIDKLGIVKRLENFATAIEAKNPPFDFNSITFGQPVKGNAFTILPISTSIQSSSTNFDRFLELVNLSGRMDTEIPIRLMEISNISIRYKGVDARTGKDKGVDFSVQLNAYSR